MVLMTPLEKNDGESERGGGEKEFCSEGGVDKIQSSSGINLGLRGALLNKSAINVIHLLKILCGIRAYIINIVMI